MTKYEPATPLCPMGLPSVSSPKEVSPTVTIVAARFGGTEPSLSLHPAPCNARRGDPGLALLDVARCYAVGAPPRIWLRGASNAAHPPLTATC
jgi:hypothetical protein